jgi:hypothetical protein
MRTLDPHHDPRAPTFLGGVAAVLAVVLFSLVLPVGVADAPEVCERQSAPSVCGGPPAAPEEALHRVTAATVVAAVRSAHAGGFLPTPEALPAAAGCAARPVDLSGFAAATSGVPFRILFCTWLN